MKWLTRLKSEKGLPMGLPKPPKAKYSSFDSDMEKHVIENTPATLRPMPYLDQSGDLVIPFSSDPKYHWWAAGGQSIEETVKEIRGKKERS